VEGLFHEFRGAEFLPGVLKYELKLLSEKPNFLQSWIRASECSVIIQIGLRI